MTVAGLLLLAVGATACTSGEGLCDGVKSVSGFVMSFQQGLDNFSEDEYSRLRMDTLDALGTTTRIHDETRSTESALLEQKIKTFEAAMVDAEWDVTVALTSAAANRAASTLGTPETLTQANVVEAAIIDRCGLPTTVEPSDSSGDTLPAPLIPSPTQTDPPTDTIDQESEAAAQGRLVATLFGLTLTRDQVECLGRNLQTITDVSSAGANMAQYQGQFQRAFDDCSIAFTVPRS